MTRAVSKSVQMPASVTLLQFNLILENLFCALCVTGKLKLNFAFNFSYFFASVFAPKHHK